jgi:predicted alpha/beta superfamily hydrolase
MPSSRALGLIAAAIGTLLVAQEKLEQPTPVIVGETRTLRTASGGDVRLEVRLPGSYPRGTRRYPVLYVLDPSSNLDHAAASAGFLAANTRMPEMIVVGVDGGNRNRDFTPTPGDGLENAGGGPAFLDRLATSVIPAIDGAYRTVPFRVLAGHSLGGLFAVWAFAERPKVFQRAIALDPSLWWNAGSTADAVAVRLRGRAEPGVLAIAECSRADESDKLLAAGSNRVRVSRQIVEGESHVSMALRGLYGSLSDVFSDYVPAMRRDADLARAEAIESQYRTLSAEYGFEVAPPEGALLEIVQRALIRRDGEDAVRAAILATRFYPDSGRAREALERARNRAASLPAIPRPPASTDLSAALAARLIGRWSALARYEPGSDIRSTLTFTRQGDALRCTVISHGVAHDGGDFRQSCLAVVVDGDSVELWHQNQGGGYLVWVLTLHPDGSMTGTEEDRYIPRPPGAIKPDIRVSIRATRVDAKN